MSMAMAAQPPDGRAGPAAYLHAPRSPCVRCPHSSASFVTRFALQAVWQRMKAAGF